MWRKPSEKRSTKKDLIDNKIKRPKTKCQSNQNNKWHVADKHPRGKYDISLK